VTPLVSPRFRTSALIAVLVLAYVFSFLDRQIISLLVEPLKRQMGLSDTDISLLQGLAFAIFLANAGLPIGRWIDTWRRTAIIAIGIAIWSATTAASGFAGSFATLLILRMGVAVGEATLTPAAHSLIADAVPGERLGFALGLYGTGTFLGLGVAYLGGAVVLSALPPSGLLQLAGLTFHPWQVVFLAIGLPGLLVAVVMALVPEPPRKAGRSRMPMKDVVAFFCRHLPAILLFNLNVAFAAMMSYALAAWMPSVLIRTFGWSAARAGAAFGTVVIVGGVAGVVLGGWLGDVVSRRRADGRLLVMAWTAMVAAPFAVTAMLASTPAAMLLWLAPAVLASTMSIGLGPSVSQAIMPSAVRGLASAIAVMIVSLVGLGLGPTVVALLTDRWFGDAHMVRYSLAVATPVMLTLAALCGLLARRGYLRALQEMAP
jgi:MFS family permease